MSRNDLPNEPTAVGKEQSKAFATQAVTAEATPYAKELHETLSHLAVQAEQGDPDLDQLRSELRQAREKFNELHQKTKFLNSEY